MEISVPTKVSSNHGKVLIAYFTVLETDGVDASSGASRVYVDGKMMGSTQYVASIISKTTSGDLFQIKTERPISSVEDAVHRCTFKSYLS